jgi:hypothetical protein
LGLADAGFVPDPESRWAFAWIPEAHSFDAIEDVPCLVLIGEPGLGKTTALRREYHRRVRTADHADEVLFVDLSGANEQSTLEARIFETEEWRRWQESDGRLDLFLDALDFALIRVETIVELLQHGLAQASTERLRLRLACRTADRPRDLETWLQRRFSPEYFEVHELLPLRRKDVDLAARSLLDEPDRFMETVIHNGLQPFAMTPTTLQLLLDVAAVHGELPSTRRELYEQGCRELCRENPARERARQTRGLPSLGERLAVAERIAGVLMLSAQEAVVPLGVDDATALTPAGLAGGIEYNQGLAVKTPFAVGEAAVDDALRTGLFTNVGNGRLGFTHQTYGEFLAGRWLTDAGFAEEQLDDLLFADTDAGLRVIPQLREIAGWLAAHSATFARRLLDRDPAVLLRADPGATAVADREMLVSALLAAVERNDLDRFDLPVRNALPHLAHAGLAGQLRRALLDRSADWRTRAIAADIAAATKLEDLQGDLVGLALDAATPLAIRSAAISALSEYANEARRRELIPLVVHQPVEDAEDELKGIALTATWPGVLTLDDLLRALKAPKRRSLYGFYKRFLRQQFVPGLTDDQLVPALRWAASTADDPQEQSILADVCDALLVRAASHLEEDEIATACADVVAQRLATHSDLVGHRVLDEHPDLFADSKGRRAITERIVGGVGEELASTLPTSTPPLVSAADIDWAIGRLKENAGARTEHVWAELIEALLVQGGVDEQVFNARAVSPILHELTAYRFDAVEIVSPEADRMRDRQRRWDELAAKREGRVEPRFDVVAQVKGAIARWEEGDLDGYWQVLAFMEDADRAGRSVATSDPRHLAGWSLVGEEERRWVVDNAVQYLREAPVEPQRWFADRIVYRPAWAAYRGLRLLFEERREVVDALESDVWARWAPVIVGWPQQSGEEETFSRCVITRLVHHAPGQAAEWLDKAILRERGSHPIYTVESFSRSVVEAVEEVVLARARDRRFEPVQRASLVEFLIGEGAATGWKLARRLVVASAVRSPGRRRELAVRVAAVLVAHSEDAAWGRIWPLIELDEAFGRDLISILAVEREHPVAGRLTEAQVGDLFTWVERRYPHAEDPPEEDGYVSPRRQIGWWRDGLLTALGTAGTSAAVTAFDALRPLFPDLLFLTRMRARAAEAARRASWLPPAPREILAMAQSTTQRWITSAPSLRRLVIETVGRVQQRLQGIDPQVRDLWNASPATPKGEQDISRWIGQQLRDQLQTRGVFLVREPEVRPSQSGMGRGESTDIWVEALVGPDTVDAHHVKVIVEVKGCWNADLETAMETQLVDRYLDPSEVTQGVYLVACFDPAGWKPDERDARRRAAAKHALGDLAEQLREQAQDVSARRSVDVEAVVLDCALPPASGAAHAPLPDRNPAAK